jgi:hypothetical protein
MSDLQDQFILKQPEPLKGCMLALRDIILSMDKNVSASWKYGMPFFLFHGKMFCYLWIDKKSSQPYVGFVNGRMLHDPVLVEGKRARMKIFPVDAERDLPIRKLKKLLRECMIVHERAV